MSLVEGLLKINDLNRYFLVLAPLELLFIWLELLKIDFCVYALGAILELSLKNSLKLPIILLCGLLNDITELFHEMIGGFEVAVLLWVLKKSCGCVDGRDYDEGLGIPAEVDWLHAHFYQD